MNSSSTWNAEYRASDGFSRNPTALAKLLHPAPACWGFANAADLKRLEAFPRRPAVAGFWGDANSSAFLRLCEEADKQLFESLKDCCHPLRCLLPHELSIMHRTRARSHNFELPRKCSTLDKSNYIFRLLYKDCF